MNNAHEQQLRDLCQKLEAAFSQRGVVQELLLLRLLNGVIGQFAATESDWRAAQSLEYRQWREQVKSLLEALGFMIASADCYACEKTGLADEVARISTQIEGIDRQLLNLTTRKAALSAELTRDQTDETNLQREIDCLEALKALAPFRAALTERLGEMRLRAMADGELARESQQQRERAEQLTHEIDIRFDELEALLRQDLTLAEQEWAALRAALRA